MLDESLVFESQDEDEVELNLSVQLRDDEEITIEAIEAVEAKEIVRNKFKWTIHSKWDSLDDLGDFLDSEGMVVFDDRVLNIGQKIFVRCNRIPKSRKRCEWCSRRYNIFLPSNSHEIILETNGKEHDHNILLKKQKRPVSSEMKAFINDLYQRETKKHSSVLLHIDAARKDQMLFCDEPNPTIRQLEYQLEKYNKMDTGKMISLGDLMKWCEQKSSYPESPDAAFVLAYEVVAEKEKQGFRFSISTPHLLEILSQCETICIDATYKLN